MVSALRVPNQDPLLALFLWRATLLSKCQYPNGKNFIKNPLQNFAESFELFL
jgi:hypothetical protein